jgi:hypothetical protein
VWTARQPEASQSWTWALTGVTALLRTRAHGVSLTTTTRANTSTTNPRLAPPRLPHSPAHSLP